jgi:hypothetical protein
MLDERRTQVSYTPKSLNDKAMLMRLSISQWTARKYDKNISEKVAGDYNTTKEAGRYNKVLIAQDAIKRISQIVTKARDFHEKQTLPWDDDGVRLLPAANYMNYTSNMRKLKSEYESAVNDFVLNYPVYVENARRSLNGMFRVEDYPTHEKLCLKYSFETKVTPLPVSSDFRVSIRDEEIQAIRVEIEMRMMNAQAVAMKDLWLRLFNSVDHMASTLSKSDPRIYDTLIGNIQEVVELLPRLNIADDMLLEKMRQEVAQKLCHFSPEALRRNPLQRAVAAQEAQQIANTMKDALNMSCSEPPDMQDIMHGYMGGR